MRSPDSNGRSSDLEDDETRGFLQEKRSIRYQEPKLSPLKQPWALFIIFSNITLFITSVALFGTWLYHQYFLINPDLRRVTSYSPIIDMVDLELKVEKINGTLFPHPDGSIARKMPNNASDAIWAEYELTRVIPVTANDLRKMGADVEIAVKLEDDIWGLGDDAYAAIFDVYHQLHCINALRRIAYADYYSSPIPDATHETLREIHVNHCIDILLQGIQCSGNVNLIPLTWRQTQLRPFPEMSINRKCINFDKLTEFRKEKSIDMDKYSHIYNNTRPPNVVQGPPIYGFAEHFGESAVRHWNAKNPGRNASWVKDS
ncbi:hypothetical protein B0O99DRAFT_684918 [Bisporella sp. PMI_857]|nr:hypothetical protein B0O99DRAFT_684918 [Bisporella sp. PMI_857]